MKTPYSKFETGKSYHKPEPNGDMIFTAWLIRHFWLMAVPPILLILACIFKNEIDQFFNSLAGHAFVSLILGFLSVISLSWAVKRVWNRFIKR